jgi:glycosyltransferase involved in cell wall biosynthesis
MMNTLAVTQSIDPVKGGGLGMAVCDLHRTMARSCYEDTVVIGIDGKHVADAERFHIRSFPGVGPAGAYFNPSLGAAVREEASRADIVHLHGFYTYPMLRGWRAARSHGKPVVRHAHGILEPWILQRSRLKKKLAHLVFEDAAFAGTTLWRALTLAEADQIRQNGGRGEIVVVPTGIDLAPIDAAPSRPADRPTLIFLSRLHKKKGLDLLLPAWQRVHAKHPGWRLAIAGKEEDGSGAAAAEFVRANNLGDSIEVVGPLPQADKFTFLKSGSAFILPSYSEGFSMGILEAMACELPVICTDACHFPEVATLGGGWECGVSVEGVAGALVALMSCGEAELAERGRQARRLAEQNYTWNKLAQDLHAACQSLPL